MKTDARSISEFLLSAIENLEPVYEDNAVGEQALKKMKEMVGLKTKLGAENDVN